ncbi:MAG: MFS transporter [Sedimentisphaerales bacterium]|jgi:FSR family fosmidomycin resistance protein-like MFS transporter|nr:MFS transporter [Sedimentisphaerales bacterium]HNY80653.1 MFS transporter [Sedimentisphaerales bacterium]HOC65504.1 MFS transporter [Sedimentisphaerales bacterium]HOH66429.1 MFS transporter [Sedimentisphaerales bacterium]HQA90947.1 MFS transporter [Sedimentisphaerales bacterium]
MSESSLRAEWSRLIVLSGVHFLVDMFGNMLPAILPVVRESFSLSLSVAAFVPASLALTANGVQMLTGHLRADEHKPFFLHLGLLLACVICVIAVAPRSGVGVAMIVVLGIVSGSGIAVTHPEGLRAVHTLSQIPPATSTAVFMTSGFLGFASGGVIAASLVSRFGLAGLYPLVLLPGVAMAAVALSRVTLAVEAESGPNGTPVAVSHRLPFWLILAIGVPAGVSTTAILQLIPTHLDTLGFALTFGGFSTAMFGWGGAVGPFAWAALALRRGDLPCSTFAFLLAAPFTFFYLLFIETRIAVALLFGAGFFSMSAYILTITLARYAQGLKLGQRMAAIVGGTWGIAYIVFMGLGALADHFGTGAVLKLTPFGYALSGLIGLWAMRKYPEMGQGIRSSLVEAAGSEHPPV